MQVEQISIFLENKPGSLDAAIKLVAEAGVSIRALSLADTTDFGILRLIVNDVAKAERVFRDAGYTVALTWANGALQTATVVARTDRECTVLEPDVEFAVKDSHGNPVVAERDGGRIRFDVRAGEVVTLTPAATAR